MKSKDQFSKGKIFTSTNRGQCKPCGVIYTTKRQRTELGLIKKIYQNQKMTSKVRNHPSPAYTECELLFWATKQGYKSLWQAWVDSGYEKALSPSCDRLDNTKSYSLENMRLVTFKENHSKQARSSVNGTEVSKKAKAVDQYTTNGTYLATYPSVNFAIRKLGVVSAGPGVVSNITNVCRRSLSNHTAYGHVWRFAGEPF